MDWKRKNLPQVENCIDHRNETPDSEYCLEETQKERSVVLNWKPSWGGQGNAHTAHYPLSSPRRTDQSLTGHGVLVQVHWVSQ